MELASLLGGLDDITISMYREALSALSSKGARVQRTATGFELRDGPSVLSIQFPRYKRTDTAIEEAKEALRNALVACSKAEYLAVLHGATSLDGDKDLMRAADTVQAALNRYETLLLFKHVVERVRRAAAENAQAASFKAVAGKYAGSISSAAQNNDDAAREPLMLEAIRQKKLFISLAKNAATNNSTSIITTTNNTTSTSVDMDLDKTLAADVVIITPPKVVTGTPSSRAAKKPEQRRSAQPQRKTVSFATKKSGKIGKDAKTTKTTTKT
jgi:hypothetical protein